MNKSFVDVLYVNGNKSYNSTYESSGQSKMIIIKDNEEEENENDDDDKFPPPRLCLLRKWPNFNNGFGFSLYEDLLNSTGSLKVENIVKSSPAEIGGLRVNDILIEVNGEYVEYKSFFHLIEILKHAFSRQEIELLVLADEDASWYKNRGIIVNRRFPNIQYCETPYYGFKFRDMNLTDINSKIIGFDNPSVLNPHLTNSNKTKNAYKSTYVINTNDEKIYKYSKPVKKSQSLKNKFEVNQNDDNEPLNNSISMHSMALDLLHDSWSEFMDAYLEKKFKSKENLTTENEKVKKSHSIKLTNNEKERSRSLHSPREKQKAFSFLYSGRDDFHQDLRPLNINKNNDINAFSKLTFLNL